jgi:2,3,4,5-tetrahydropyridine-2-carboxylate N-succinyltransferase
MVEAKMNIKELKEKIDEINESNDLSRSQIDSVEQVIEALDKGLIRVAEFNGDDWLVNEWIKKSILLYFKEKKLKPISSGDISYFDKIDTKSNYKEAGIRVVPPGVVRYGSFCEPGVIVMPGYVNIGAYVGSGTMVDTWATVGSCAQVGKNVHISGGVGIGGVLEPPSAMPVIIEDNVFIGSRCILVEGVRISQGAVLGANVTLTSSTPIIDVTGEEPVEYKGLVPENSVVIPGTRPKEFPAGTYETTCALIIGKRKDSTNKKTSLNDVLRTFEVQV